jgi:hypothetical protein
VRFYFKLFKVQFSENKISLAKYKMREETHKVVSLFNFEERRILIGLLSSRKILG